MIKVTVDMDAINTYLTGNVFNIVLIAAATRRSIMFNGTKAHANNALQMAIMLILLQYVVSKLLSIASGIFTVTRSHI